MNIKFKAAIVAACGFFVISQASAQSWKDLFNSDNVSKVVNAVSEKIGLNSSVNMVGTWSYSGAAVDFKSDNLLKKAGGMVASSTVENEINAQLKKAGITAGVTTFTFAADSTFTCVTQKRKINGTYSYNANESTVSLKYGILPVSTAKVSASSNSMSLLFEADKLLQFIALVGNKVNNATLKTISKLASEYDGMNVGVELLKK